MTESDDFVGIIGSLTNFVQNQRIASYNEAVDDMQNSVRGWIVEQGVKPVGEHIPELLDDFIKKWAQIER